MPRKKWFFSKNITSCTICTEDKKKGEKFSKVSKKLSKVVKKVVKKLSKSCQKVAKKMAKLEIGCKNTKILKQVGGGGGGGEGDL
jgi:hypothetical protein